jgi:tRNA-dihydrouridine synthase A
MHIVNDYEHPITIQLAGSDPKKFSQCSKIIEGQGFNEINLNIGCPSSKVLKGQFGACLMSFPERVADIVTEVKNSCSLPVSIKTRLGLGYDEGLDLLREFITRTSEAGCKIFFIHARNAILNGISAKKNRKIPPLRYEDAFKIKKEFYNFSIILNGGITTIEEVINNLDLFDGIMIGRKIYDDPMFLLNIENEIYRSNLSFNKETVLEKYMIYIHKQTNLGIKKYLLFRHLFGLYYKTNLSKKWKNFLHMAIRDEVDILKIPFFEKIIHEKEI